MRGVLTYGYIIAATTYTRTPPLSSIPPPQSTFPDRLAEQAREAERSRRESAVKAAQYERTAKEELDILLAKRAAAKKVGRLRWLPYAQHAVQLSLGCTGGLITLHSLAHAIHSGSL
jgi:hypothetical protein